MKKFFTIVMLIASASVLFAGGFDFKTAEKSDQIYVSPYSYQNVTFKGDYPSFPSTYGFGVGDSFRVMFTDRILAQAEVSFTSYSIKDRSQYSNIAILLKGGYKYDINDKFYVIGAAGLGLDIAMYGGKTGCYFTLGADVAGGYQINDKLAIEAKVDFTWQSQGSATYKSNCIAITPSVGAGYTF